MTAQHSEVEREEVKLCPIVSCQNFLSALTSWRICSLSDYGVANTWERTASLPGDLWTSCRWVFDFEDTQIEDKGDFKRKMAHLSLEMPCLYYVITSSAQRS